MVRTAAVTLGLRTASIEGEAAAMLIAEAGTSTWIVRPAETDGATLSMLISRAGAKTVRLEVVWMLGPSVPQVDVAMATATFGERIAVTLAAGAFPAKVGVSLISTLAAMVAVTVGSTLAAERLASAADTSMLLVAVTLAAAALQEEVRIAAAGETDRSAVTAGFKALQVADTVWPIITFAPDPAITVGASVA